MKEKFTMSETCIVCHERDYGMHIMPKKKMCKTCNEESKRLGVRTEGSTHAMFGASNYMHPTPVPSVISDLTRLEVDCIRKICPQTKIYCRKGGKFLAHFFFFFLRSSCLISSQQENLVMLEMLLECQLSWRIFVLFCQGCPNTCQS